MRIRTILRVIIFCLYTFLSANNAQAATAGTMEYNTNLHQMTFFDGTKWYGLALGLPLGSCTREGAMDFSMILTTYQYCNGTNWIKILGTLTLNVCTVKGQMDFRNSTYMVCNGLLWMDIKGNPIVS